MLRTRVGYAGGTTKDPTYERIGDHTETVAVDFDPKKISYRDLLAVFWKTHNPCGTPWSRQYMSAIFTHGEEQARLAKETCAAEEKRRGKKIHTVIAPAGTFTPAEDYHQKYQLQGERALAAWFRKVYPGRDAFMNSTAAARVNGYLSGYGSKEQFAKELDSFGLPADARKELLKYVER